MQLLDLIVAIALLLLSTFIFVTVLAKLKFKSSYPNLPPGSFGIPILGESIEFMRAIAQGNPNRFIFDRINKYKSDVFKTSLLGERVVVLCGPTGNKFLFSNENKMVQVWWPTSFQKLVGSALPTKVGEEARIVKKMVMTFFNGEVVMKYVGVMDEVARHHFLTHWEGKKELRFCPAVKLYTLELACRYIMNIMDPQTISKLSTKLDIFHKGLLSIPLNVPGTRFYAAMKTADDIRKELWVILKQRKLDLEEKISSPFEDLMSYLLATPDENGKFMPEIDIINNTLDLLFAARDVPSSTLPLIMKYLSEMPQVLENVRKEQMEVAASKAPGELLQWEDLQKMKYSWNVISEVIRVTPPVVATFRKALVDFTFEGYSIPKGWKLYWSASATHHHPSIYERPEKFDESRFDFSGPAPFCYVPFGGGPRMCLGKDFARVEMLVFLHNVVNKFEWQLLAPKEQIIYDFMPTPEKGLPIRIQRHRGLK